MLLRWAFAGLAAVLLPLGSAHAQSAAGAFDSLSPGNQKIARALFEAEAPTGAVPGTTATPLTLDEIAARKLSGEGWGRIFQDMKAQGLVGAKNLGQVVSRFEHPSRGPVVTASGRPFDDGSRHGGLARFGDSDGDRGRHGIDFAPGDHGAGRGQSFANGPGRPGAAAGHVGRGGK